MSVTSVHVVTLYRKNGRVVKKFVARSRYAAKQVRDAWESKYDGEYYVEIEKSSLTQDLTGYLRETENEGDTCVDAQ